MKTLSTKAVANHSKMSHRTLLVTIVEARNLKKTDTITDDDAYVELYMSKDYKQKTSIIKDTNSPTWNEQFLFNLKPEDDHLTVKVYDDDLTGQDDVGETKIRLKKVKEAGGYLDTWINLPTAFGRGSNGEIHVIMKLVC